MPCGQQPPDIIDREDRSRPPRPTHSRSHGIMPTSQSQRPRIDISDGACEVTHQAQRRQGTGNMRALEACSEPRLAHSAPCRATEAPTFLSHLLCFVLPLNMNELFSCPRWP